MTTTTNDTPKRPRTAAIAIAAAVALAGLSGCAEYKPKEFTSHDDCRDCPPGLFTGEDGVGTVTF